jgi:hypothetical protein
MNHLFDACCMHGTVARQVLVDIAVALNLSARVQEDAHELDIIPEGGHDEGSEDVDS